MNKKRIFAGFLFGMFCLVPGGFAEDVLALHHQGKKAVPTQAGSASQAASDKVLQKLDQLLKAQEEILRQFEEIKKELYIIKVRASR